MKRSVILSGFMPWIFLFLLSGCSQHYPAYQPVGAKTALAPAPSKTQPVTRASAPTASQTTLQPTAQAAASSTSPPPIRPASQSTHQPMHPPVAQTASEPLPPIWPEITLIGRNPAKVSLVYAELIRQGWDSSKILMITDKGKKSSVQVIVVEGEAITIPTSNRVLTAGLCEEQLAMIETVVRRNRPSLTRGCCDSYPIDVRTWLDARGLLEEPKAWPCTVAWPNERTWLDSINGPLIEEFRKSSGWRYRYGVKKEDCIYFTDCIDSSTRIHPAQLPWGGNWTLVMERTDRKAVTGKTLRVWRKQ